MSGSRCGPKTASSGHRRARRSRGGRGLARGLNRITPLNRTPRRSRLGDGRRGSRGFCGARADLGGYGEDRSESLSAAGKFRPRPGQRSTVVTDAETRAMNLPEGAERSSILICGLCVRKLQESAEVKGSPPKKHFPCGALAHPRQHLPCGARVHPNRHPESARRERSTLQPV